MKAAGFLGTDSFSYSVDDGLGGTGTALVTVKVGYLTINSDIFSIAFDVGRRPRNAVYASAGSRRLPAE